MEQATHQFYTSLNALLAGDAAGMDQVWSHADKVTCMGPLGGILTGWDQVQTTFAELAGEKLGGHAEATDLHFTVGDDLAVVECYEVGVARNAQGETQPYRIRATNSFRKENGQWKMIGHHTDLFAIADDDSDRMSDERTTPTRPNGTRRDSTNRCRQRRRFDRRQDDKVILDLEH